MKLKVKVKFQDKNDKSKVYEKDAIVDFKKARAEELLADERGLVEEVDKDATPADEANGDADK